jgi:hypothetical protein
VTTKKYETVLIEKQDGITWLIMNRPDKRNAMSPQLHLEMDEALEDLAIDPETEVVVLTGAGEAFCAGQDIKLYFRGGDADPVLRRKAGRASNQWRWQKLSTFPKPTIAMINGYCFGRGRRGGVRPLRGELGDPARRHRVVERRADPELSRRHVLRAHRRYLRRQEGQGDRVRQLLLSQGEADGQGMKQFLDDKSYRPGFGAFKRQKARRA